MSKYNTVSFKATGIAKSGKSKGRIQQFKEKLNSKVPRGQRVESMKPRYKQGEWP